MTPLLLEDVTSQVYVGFMGVPANRDIQCFTKINIEWIIVKTTKSSGNGISMFVKSHSVVQKKEENIYCNLFSINYMLSQN